MNKYREELYKMLAEEAAEIIQCCTKILRHGEYSYNPDIKEAPSNLKHLRKELADFEAVLELLDRDALEGHEVPIELLGPLRDEVDEAMRKKRAWMHNNTVTGL